MQPVHLDMVQKIEHETTKSERTNERNMHNMKKQFLGNCSKAELQYFSLRTIQYCVFHVLKGIEFLNEKDIFIL